MFLVGRIKRKLHWSRCRVDTQTDMIQLPVMSASQRFKNHWKQSINTFLIKRVKKTLCFALTKKVRDYLQIIILTFLCSILFEQEKIMTDGDLIVKLWKFSFFDPQDLKNILIFWHFCVLVSKLKLSSAKTSKKI